MKLCGCKESCFKEGGQWGHFEGVLCMHLTDDGKNDICTLNNQKVLMYWTEEEYKQQKEKQNEFR